VIARHPGSLDFRIRRGETVKGAGSLKRFHAYGVAVLLDWNVPVMDG
jgi:hypothetical protein